MPFMRISQGPLYAKKGTPKDREQRRFQQLADDIFAEILPPASRPEPRQCGWADDAENTQTAEAPGADNRPG